MNLGMAAICLRRIAGCSGENAIMKKKNLFNVALAGVMLSLLTLVAAPAHAADPVRDISSFVTCLNSITTTPRTVVDAVACVPSPGCYTTLTVSEESAQPGC